MHSFLCKIVVHDILFLKLSNLFLDFYIIFIRLDTGWGKNLVLAFCWPHYQNRKMWCISNSKQGFHLNQCGVPCPSTICSSWLMILGSPGYPYHCSGNNKVIITSLQEVNMPPSQIRLQPQCWKQPPPCTRIRPPPPNVQNYMTRTLLPSLLPSP